jgi:outer membrane protein OmpA-like peptidoglycan-associated protein
MKQLNGGRTGGWNRRHMLGLAAALPLLAAVQPAAAQAVRLYRADAAPSAQEVADILAQGARRSMKQRGVRLLPGESPPAPEPQHVTDDAAEASAFAMPIPFAFDSARLEPAALQLLAVVAEGIRLNHGTLKVVIAGHTDAQGPVAYNERLSLRRAEAVRRYLVEAQGLDAQTLQALGQGPHQPVDPRNPYAPHNRRVQFHAA